jgi:hypothetical protein
MATRAAYRPNRARNAELRALVDEAVLAGAAVVQAAVVEKFAERNQGYKDGKYATGAAATIEIGPLYTRRGVRRADVFTEAFREGKDGPAFYPAFWEFGHLNVFTLEYERVETFAPVMAEQSGNVWGAMIRAIHAFRGSTITKKTGALSVGINLEEWGI